MGAYSTEVENKIRETLISILEKEGYIFELISQYHNTSSNKIFDYRTIRKKVVDKISNDEMKRILTDQFHVDWKSILQKEVEGYQSDDIIYFKVIVLSSTNWIKDGQIGYIQQFSEQEENEIIDWSKPIISELLILNDKEREEFVWNNLIMNIEKRVDWNNRIIVVAKKIPDVSIAIGFRYDL